MTYSFSRDGFSGSLPGSTNAAAFEWDGRFRGHDDTRLFAVTVPKTAIAHGGNSGDVRVSAAGGVDYIDIPANSSTSFEVALGVAFYDRLETAGDHDWIRLDLAAGQHVTLVLNGFGSDDLADPYLRLRDSAGTQVAENDDQDLGVILDSRIEYTATTAGAYYIDIGAYADDYAGNYELLVFDSTSTVDTIAGGTATNVSLRAGGSYHGVIETAGDSDWIAVELRAGEEFNVHINGSGPDALSGGIVRVRNAQGQLVAQDQSTTSDNAAFTFTAGRTGTFYIEATAAGAANTGEYVIEMRRPLEFFTYDQISDQLTSGYWGGLQRSFDVGADNSLTVNITGLTAAGQFLARAALQTWTDVTGIRFAETAASAEITFQDSEAGAYSSSQTSGGRIVSSIVNVSTDWLATSGTGIGSYSFQTYIHEIGHALGLGHAGDYDGTADYANDALYLNDSWGTTVMSYFSPLENRFFADRGFTRNYINTPMNGDIVAVTELYGLSATTRNGDTRYGVGSTAGNPIYNIAQHTPSYTIVDSGGFDTLDYSGTTASQRIDLNPETFMNVWGEVGNVSIGRGTVIESAHGGDGDDTIVGNGIGNVLFGRGGTDTIDGFFGQDLVYGGPGNDTIHGDQGDDRLYGSIGNDTVFGDDANDRLFGEGGNDTLDGGLGDDIIYGALGNDTLVGQAGMDWLYGGAGADVISGNSGTDMVRGGDGDDRIYGGDNNDELYGEAGNDRIEGGNHADFIWGGDGSDLLFGQDGIDTIRGELGIDTIYGGNGDDVLDGGGGDDAIYGGSENDYINGNFGNDTIRGGYGADILIGGEGDDLFVFDTPLVGANVDRINDFGAGSDKIALDRAIFDQIYASGTLAPGAFRQGPEAVDGDDRIVYRKDTGEIFYDADGLGGGAAVLFAKVTPGTALSHADFTAFLGSQAEAGKASAMAVATAEPDPLHTPDALGLV